MLAPRLGTRSYVAERVERARAAQAAEDTGRDDRVPGGGPVYDDGRVVVNVNLTCGEGVGGGGRRDGGAGCGAPRYRGGPGYDIGPGYAGGLAVAPSLPGMWPLPPLSAGPFGGGLLPGLIYGAYGGGGGPMLLPPMMAWSSYAPPPPYSGGACCGD